MIIFPTSRALRNILQNNFCKTFCKHNLLLSNITIMIWIQGIQCLNHLNPNLPHASVTESFGPQLQLVLHTFTWCSTPVTDVAHLQLVSQHCDWSCKFVNGVAQLQLVLQTCNWCYTLGTGVASYRVKLLTGDTLYPPI